MLQIPLLALPGLTRAAVDARRARPGGTAHRGAAALAAEGCAAPLDSHRRHRCAVFSDLDIDRALDGGCDRGGCRGGRTRPQALAQGAARHPRAPAALRLGRSARAPDAAARRVRRRRGDRPGQDFGGVAPRQRRRRRAPNSSAARALPTGRWALAPLRIGGLARQAAADCSSRAPCGYFRRWRKPIMRSRCATNGRPPRRGAGGGMRRRVSGAQHACRPGARPRQESCRTMRRCCWRPVPTRRAAR